jgi:hypothetical protein
VVRRSCTSPVRGPRPLGRGEGVASRRRGRAGEAFVSHSSLDQGRFVRHLAQRLHANGVETWYAEWALLDEDSLTEKIFERGIAEADIFIVVLSQHTVDSNWVKAELAVGLVRQIERKCRLIPIVLDGVEAPVALQGTLQRRITDPASYDNEFDALLRSIFNKPTTPPLGNPPSYTRAPSIRGMSPADAVVYAALVKLAIERNGFLVDGDQLHERCAADEVSDAGVVEAIHVFDKRSLIKDAHVYDGRMQHVQLRPRMVREYVVQTTDLHALEQRLIAGILNAPERAEVGQLADEVGIPPVVAEAVLDRLDRRLYKLEAMMGGQVYVDGISPLLARELDH